MVRVGIVKTINHDKKTARVLFPDTGMMSGELRIVCQRIDWMPAIEDEVLCVYTEQKEGFIVGTLPDVG